jgi:hypothetical protein
VAAQRDRHSLADLIARAPADGLVDGAARIDGDLFGDRAACAALAYQAAPACTGGAGISRTTG